MEKAATKPRTSATDKPKSSVSYPLLLLGIAIVWVVFVQLILASHVRPTQMVYDVLEASPRFPKNATKNMTSSSSLNKTSVKAPVVAYAISLIKCGDRQTTSAGLIDAALILRHSVHMTSIRNPESGSKYDYKMYAFVHKQAEACSKVLRTVGFEIVVVDHPVEQKDIRGEHLRSKIHKEWCCGHQEFIKWEVYRMVDHPVAVHVDIDFAFMQPMDELFDAIIHPATSSVGHAARQLIPLEFPKEHTFPERIDAFITRDWPQVPPGRTPLYQAGFIVARPDPSVYDELTEIVLEGNYSGGWGTNSGWGGLGYGGYVGAMAMQGLIAYYYDIVRPNAAVQVNQCRYNWMGMDVLYRAPPNFRQRHPKRGKCRNDRGMDCEQCYETNTSLIKSVHYTQCRKPWNCVGEGVPGGAKGKAIDTNAGDYAKCMEIVRMWHDYRTDFESKLYSLTTDERILNAAKATYKTEIFQGHCNGEGGGNYRQIDASPESFAKVPLLYK